MDQALQILPWLILFMPMLSALAITLFTMGDRELSAKLSIGAVVAGFGLTVLYVAVAGWEPKEFIVPWLEVGDEFQVDFGLRLDALSLLMLLIVTGVGGAIHIYSYGYMREDRGFARYFACLSLFTFSMLGIVLANNFLLLFIFWELVGVSSYLLIGFWYERPSAAEACKKAFLTNRLGDFGFLLGILLIWSTLGSLNFSVLSDELDLNPQALGALATTAVLLIFCGAAGKSAQFPLHVWLPDAMEGPTPVSALIHAATMVAAGVYMLCRVFFLLALSPLALEVIAWIGGVTALLSALIAVQQNDIKRILAYSTLSQLGYMVMGVGLQAPAAAMFHLTTHACFKALLFLGAGSVIVALHHEQDIWRMGGLKSKMPVTFWTFMVGTLALCGIWPFSGFYSKDAILAAAVDSQHFALFGLGVLVAVLTTFYMFRLVLVAFMGSEKSEAPAHAHDTPPVMIWPLRLLAVMSVAAAFLGIDDRLKNFFDQEEVHGPTAFFQQVIAPFSHSSLAAFSGLLAAGVGFCAAWSLYRRASQDPLPERLGHCAQAMRDRFYFDELYAKLIAHTQEALARLADAFDRWIIAGLMVRGIHGTTELFGRALRLMQTGNLQTYAFFLVVGVASILYFVLLR